MLRSGTPSSVTTVADVPEHQNEVRADWSPDTAHTPELSTWETFLLSLFHSLSLPLPLFLALSLFLFSVSDLGLGVLGCYCVIVVFSVLLFI